MYTLRDFYTGDALCVFSEERDAIRYCRRRPDTYVTDDDGNTITGNVDFPF